MPDFFDLVIQEIVNSAEVAVSPAAARPSTARRRHRIRWSRGRLLAMLGLVCIPGAVGGLALAGTFDGQRISPQEWVNGRRVTPAVAVSAAQAQLAILRRTRVASDAMLPWDAFRMTHSPEAANGVNPLLSRRAEGFVSGGAWLIPGNGTVCLETENAQAMVMSAAQLPPGARTPVAVPRIPGAMGVAGCTTDANAANGWSAGTSSARESPGMIFTAGTVPDGVSAVTVHLSGREPVSLSVHENVYMGEVHGWPASVSFTGPEGATTISN